MKRPLCIGLWTVAAAVFAYEWMGFTFGLSNRWVDRVAQAVGGSTVVLMFMHIVLETLPAVFVLSILGLGVIGRLPGTRRFRIAKRGGSDE
jgi:hypothetical protein